MLDWQKATYPKETIDPRAYITTLEFAGVSGVYNVYKMSNGEFITTFNNQPEVRNYVDLNLGSIFMVRFLHPTDNKYMYLAPMGKEEIPVKTLASVVVLIPGSEEFPRKLHYDSQQLIYIE